jgi:hypothetical protein
LLPERLSFICDAARAATVSTNPRTSGEPPSGIRLFGISVRKVYPLSALLQKTVGSYPTFSPLPYCYGGYFLWHYLYPAFAKPHPLGGALLYTVRTFLPCKNKGDNPIYSLYKVRVFYSFGILKIEVL